MKNKILLKLTFILSLAIFTPSCSDPEPLVLSKEDTAEKTSCDFRLFEDDVLVTLSQDTEDIQNSRINFILYHFALVTKDLLKTSEWKAIVSEELNDSQHSSLSIRDLCYSNPEVSSFYNDGLYHSISQNLSKSNPFNWSIADLNSNKNNLVGFLTEALVYRQYKYFPTISVNVNEDIFDGISDNYIVAIAEQINAEDEIVAYQNNCIVLISEEDANSFDGTILFIGISNDPQDVPEDQSESTNLMTEKNDSHENNLSEKSSQNWNLYLTEYQIKKGYNFEKSGRSELCGGMGTLYYAWGTGLKHNFIGNMRFCNIKVSRSDIKKSKKFKGDWHAENQKWRMSDNACNNTQNQELNCEIPDLTLIMFEHDWYANYKWYEPTCWTPNAPNTTSGFRAKFAHEYYWRGCQQHFYNKGNGWFQVDGQEKYVSNYKGSFRFRRGAH